MRFVLVHGSWHEGSSWDRVVAELTAAGHEAYAPTIAGHGPGVAKDVDHEDCWRSIVEYIVAAELDDVVLVGHSFGGTIISKVAEAVPERLRRLVFQNAFVVADGNSLDDETPPHYRALFAQLAAESDDNTVLLPYPVWREAFINDGDESIARQTYAYLSPEPMQPFLDKLDLGKFYSLEKPKSYINFTEDTALPPGEWGWHPRMSSRLGLHRLVQKPGSHEVVFTNPGLLAAAIIEAGRD